MLAPDVGARNTDVGGNNDHVGCTVRGGGPRGGGDHPRTWKPLQKLWGSRRGGPSWESLTVVDLITICTLLI